MYKQLFTLKSHTQSVSSVASYHNGQWFIVSGDTDGNLVLWDLTTRRPIITWKGHDGNILSIKQWHNYIMTQSRDSSLKIWKISDNATKEMFQLPTNSLNFCNFETFQDYVFVPASVDSNNFDCYKINPSTFDFTRVISNFDPFSLLYDEVVDSNGRNNFGIIMKLAYIPTKNTLAVAFESGDLLALHIDWNQNEVVTTETTSATGSKIVDKLLINKDPTISLLYHNSSHSPNPITAMAIGDNSIISGSTNNKIIVHDIENGTFEIIKVGSSGIQSIAKLNTSFLIGYWNGTIEARSDSNQLFTISRATPSVTNSETPKSAIKLTSLLLLVPEIIESQTTSYKQLVQSKRKSIHNSPLLISGYEDGVIVVHSVFHVSNTSND
jgi:WD40 repeat protein